MKGTDIVVGELNILFEGGDERIVSAGMGLDFVWCNWSERAGSYSRRVSGALLGGVAENGEGCRRLSIAGFV
jgi:hypothetical protein